MTSATAPSGEKQRRAAFSGTVRSERRANGSHAPLFSASLSDRPSIRGKFFFSGERKLWIRGVTYGAFLADDEGREYVDLAQIERDFAQMSAAGINAVRIPHTTPPRALLDIAENFGLRVMVGLSAEQFAGFLIDRKDAPDIDEIVRQKVRSVAGHPALLCYALGNEIQAPVARWIGHRKLEKYLERLFKVVKAEDPAGLVTYVNYPSTEYLTLPFLDFLCFNVYLESKERLSSYLARLQNLASDRPLMMGELGLDSMRNGEDSQAESVEWQIRTAFEEGCAGSFVFSWTDEWYRGKERVEDWAFGLTRLDRTPKPALEKASAAFAEVPFHSDRPWPRISVVVCTHNGAATLRECLAGLTALEYPDYEIIVVDDGSRDASASIASGFDVRVISTPNMGLSSARNTGAAAATGEIVAYIDDDAEPDPAWLAYLADSFMKTSDAAVGGPNIAPGDGRIVADAVENAPGGPVHVLLSDRSAEHIPGCNMAFRRETLLAIGGFDEQFRTAGDDVDVCWRILERGWTIGFNAGAVVIHHRRKSLRHYWRQQWGYGRAEAQLERKWPEKYNSVGGVQWGGRLYGKGLASIALGVQRVYHGVWGLAPFQRLYQPHHHGFSTVPMVPEWYLLAGLFATLSLLGVFWGPLLAALPIFIVMVSASMARGAVSAAGASFPGVRSPLSTAVRRLITTILYFIQPIARLGGRIGEGLNPLRTRAPVGLSVPWPRGFKLWTDRGSAQEDRLAAIEGLLRDARFRILRGSAFSRWDIEVLGGMFGGARLMMAVEEHGGGHQYVRARYWPHLRRVKTFVGLQAVLLFFAAWARMDSAGTAFAALSGVGIVLAVAAIRDCACAVAALRHATAGQMEQVAGPATDEATGTV